MKTLTLGSFHNKLIDGFVFCRKAYALLEQIKREPNGIQRIRARKSQLEKKLIEELLPLAKYIQLKYRPGNTVKVRWLNGNQNYDAVIRQSGFLADNGYVRPESHLEITCAVHPNDHLARELSAADKPVYGLEGLTRDKATKMVVSLPTVRTGYEHVDRFVQIIADLIKKKSAKSYPTNTTLLVDCNLDIGYDRHEWDHLIRRVQEQTPSHPFIEIILFDRFEARHSSLHQV
jgi:hypothetical protein